MYLLCYLPSYHPEFCLGDPLQLLGPSRHVLIILTPSENGLDSSLEHSYLHIPGETEAQTRIV